MLYKYLPPERIDVLSNLRIRFSQPRSLNDPFETAPLINFDGKAALVEFAEKKFHDFWDSCPSEMQTEENKREFEKTLKASAKEIEKRTSAFSVGQELSRLIKKHGSAFIIQKQYEFAHVVALY